MKKSIFLIKMLNNFSKNFFVTLEGHDPSTPSLRTDSKIRTCDILPEGRCATYNTNYQSTIFRDNRELVSDVLYPN